MRKQQRQSRQITQAQSAADAISNARNGVWRRGGGVFVAAVLMTGAVWAAYGRSVDTPFLFDDPLSIVNNRSIRRLWPLVGDADHPGPLNPGQYNPVAGRPLVNLTLALNYHFGGLDPHGYHVLNIWLHVLSALVLFAIVRRTLRLPCFQGRFDTAADPLALAVSLVWALHPLQTEAVIYVTQRTELLVGFCYLATLYGSLRYWAATTRGGRATWLALAVLASLAGMASKEVMVTAPVVVLLFERAFVTRSFRRAWQQSWPLYVGLAATWGLLLALNYSGPRSDTAGFHVGVPLAAWWLTQAKVFWMYLKLAVWPWPVAIHYGMPYLDSLAAAWPWLLGTVLVAIALAILLWRNHPVGFLGAWVLLVLSPTLVVPIATEVAAERRMYLPLAALVALVIVGAYLPIQRAVQRLRTEDKDPGPIFAAASCTLVAVLLVSYIVTTLRLAVYQDPLALWRSTVASQPKDSLALVSLGVQYERRGQYDEATRLYQRAVELKSDYAEAHNALGNMLGRAGQVQQAIKHFEQAVQLDPNFIDAHYSYGVALMAAGRRQEGIAQFEEALRLNPDFAEAYWNLLMAQPKENPEEAISAAYKALELARSNSKPELAEKIETWLRRYQASLRHSSTGGASSPADSQERP
jgi:tetratricopeptide (TPR) repeat protein